MKNVFCMKWGTKFPPLYVNILAAMVRRNLQSEHRFVCFTDNADGLDKRIEVRPLPEMQIDPNQPERCWRKLSILGNNLGGDLTGSALFLDLDVVILDDLEPFFSEAGDFIIAPEWGYRDKVVGNSSVFRFEIGKYQDVLAHFISHDEEIRKQYRNDQWYLSHSIADKGQLKHWNPEWCRSFKRHCLQPFPLCYFLPPKKPVNAKIVIFHGNPNPDAVQKGWTGHCGLRAAKPANWIQDNWRE